MPPHNTDRWRDFFGPGALTSFALAALTAVLGLGLPLLWRCRQVIRMASQDERIRTDAILILGRALEIDRPTAVFRARLEHGADLWRAGFAPRIIVTGGLTGDATRTEAAVGKEYLLAQGVPAEAVLCEDRSRHTLENLFNVRKTLVDAGWASLLIVSDPLHLRRIAAYANGFGLATAYSPARAALPRGRLRWWLRAVKEGCLVHWYYVGVAYARAIRSETLLSRVT